MRCIPNKTRGEKLTEETASE